MRVPRRPAWPGSRWRLSRFTNECRPTGTWTSLRRVQKQQEAEAGHTTAAQMLETGTLSQSWGWPRGGSSGARKQRRAEGAL